MSIFKNLFSKPRVNTTDSEEQLFDEEWERALVRFRIVTGTDLHFQMLDPRTGRPGAPHLGLAATFAEWQESDTAYDRRRILFQFLYQLGEESMSPWQKANFLTADSRPAEALQILREANPPSRNDPDYAAQCASHAVTLISMTQVKEALKWAEEAAKISADRYVYAVLADALHLAEDHERAHQIYNALIGKAAPCDPDALDAVGTVFNRLFARESGLAPSPVLCLKTIEAIKDCSQSDRAWLLAETEFYYNPYFRLHHAYHLARMGEANQAFAKLYGLVDEMPWLREASLNLAQYFDAFDPTGTTIAPEFQAALRQRIQENGWISEEMVRIDSKPH